MMACELTIRKTDGRPRRLHYDSLTECVNDAILYAKDKGFIVKIEELHTKDITLEALKGLVLRDKMYFRWPRCEECTNIGGHNCEYPHKDSYDCVFFNSDGKARGMTPEEEKEQVLERVKEALENLPPDLLLATYILTTEIYNQRQKEGKI